MIEVGETIGNYQITAKLGEGGMGIVFLAEHPVIGRKVALKAIHPELSRNPDVVSRFITEAKSVNQIGNEHIVDVHDFGNTAAGDFYFIMEYLQGEALSDLLTREGPLTSERAYNIAAQVADALGASHQHGIIHRDLKPENIFLINRAQSTDFVKVLDFGLAKLTLGEEKVSHKTRTGSVMGTPYYMAPEQCEGRASIDHRADIYSLGVILFEMLTGRVPFGGEGYGEIIVKHLTQPPPSPREINPAVGLAAEALVHKALGKAREARFQSMSTFREALLEPEKFLSSGGADRSSTTLVRDTAPVARALAGSAETEPSPRPPSSERGGAHKVPMPTTFRHGTGELVEEAGEAFAAARSRRGLVIAAALVAAAAGVTGLYFFRGMDGNAGDPTSEVVSTGVPNPAPAAAAVPATVRIAFSSDPAGADVLLKDTGERLGATPFESDVAYSSKPVTFVFAKPQFQKKERSVTPDRSSHVDTTLPPLAEPAAAAVGVPGSGGADRPGAGGATSRTRASKPARPRRPRPQPIDSDGVLRPQGL